ncbi:MAG: LPP20 family lipoprotein [Bacillota bacterium]
MTVKTSVRILSLAAFLLLTACGMSKPQDAQPDWVTGNSATYPAGSYLIGRGQADEMAVAKDRARAELAKVFSVNISEQTHDTSSYSQTNAGGTPVMQNTMDVSRNVSTRTDQVLSGVNISDTWQDPKTHQYYALATLSRSQAAAAFRQQIGDLDAGTTAYLSQAQNSSDLFDKISAAGQAVDAQQTRAGLQRALQVVDVTGTGIPPQWPLAKLQADRAALLKQFQVSAAADGRNAEGVKKVLAGALGDAGFTVADGAPYTMTANLDAANLKPQGGWYWITGTLQVTLNGSGRAHGVRRWDLKVSGTDPQLAEQRLMDQVAQYLQNDIQGTVLGFASGKSGTP